VAAFLIDDHDDPGLILTAYVAPHDDGFLEVGCLTTKPYSIVQNRTIPNVWSHYSSMNGKE